MNPFYGSVMNGWLSSSDERLHNKRRSFMSHHTPAGRIIKETFTEQYSEFVTSAGGDVTAYRVYGLKPDAFSCCIK